MSAVSEIRKSNEQRALATLYRDGAMTRAELARRLEVTRSTAGILVDRLLHEGLAEQRPANDPAAASPTTASARGPIGRPGRQVALRPDGGWFLGAEIGVGHLDVVLLDLEAKPRERLCVAHDGRSHSPQHTLARLAELLDEVVATLPAAAVADGGTVTVPGYMDDAGTCYAAQLDWRGVPLGDLLEATFGAARPWLLENDANAAAVAESYPRAGDGERATIDQVLVLIEDGVGAGIVQAGRLQRGRRLGAGEIGHMPLSGLPGETSEQPDARFESHVGRAAVLQDWHERGGSGDTAALLAACVSGEPSALAVAHAWAITLARGLACMACTIEPQSIVIGGSVGGLVAHADVALQQELARLLPPGYHVPGVARSALGDGGCAIGAACLQHDRFLHGVSALVPATSPTECIA